MSKSDFKNYINAQIEEMNKYKWIESEKAGYDLGNNAIHDWIIKYAKLFRETYISNHKVKAK